MQAESTLMGKVKERGGGRGIGRRLLLPVAVPFLLLIVWSLAAQRMGVLSRFLAPPWDVAATLWRLLLDGSLVTNTAASLGRVLIGLGAAALIGIPTGILVGWWPTARQALSPLLEFLRPVPIAAWVPLSVLVFGIGETPARVLILLGAIHPIILNTALGVSSVEKLHLRAAQMMGASHRAIVLKVVLPSALPSVVAGIRLGLGVAWWVVIVAELLAVRSGLGYMMVQAQALIRSDIIMAGIIAIGVVGLALNRLALWAEQMITPWRRFQ